MSLQLGAILTNLAPDIGRIVDQAIVDKDLATQLKTDLITAQLQAAASVVATEAQGESWLQRNWRPMTMMWFCVLIGAYWFGFVPVNMPTEHVQSLFTLVQIGLGGYVVGRTVEKTAATIAPSLRRR